ncbi:D-xylose transport system permease component [Klebsiella pneumoniae]|uniref:D-xylose transport system permease component n=1 Tax=Klebsiella pneumoniae TaxID=573 RepID=A0A4P0YI96_KLEPN|nr:D-xylose transport system permease component [Klebsiella pneumoniae]
MVVAYRKVPSFIVTLAGMLAFRGILIGITNGTTVSPTSPAMSQIGQSYLPDGIGFASALSAWRCLSSGSGAGGCAGRR